ncbi:hypothetical protein L3081_11575 [Colwellia sp. MSW7]|uniref:Exopolyphosphatase n=1 Tax=Colwellia maritima TaxID=2912588 RepID=A0ABS9X0Z8_9GAMM|nr:hypothetical protein [Colwellia maritima]MCI2283926.1 hypothetical protein [Colwellia maritima]
MPSKVTELNSVIESNHIKNNEKSHQTKSHLVAIDLGSNSFHLIIAQESASAVCKYCFGKKMQWD